MLWGELTPEGQESVLRHIQGLISHMSLHSGKPTVQNELPGGFYRRVSVDFLAPQEDRMRSTRKVIFRIPEGSRVTHAAFWTAEIGGTMVARGEVSNPKSFRGRGEYEVDLSVFEFLTNSEGSST